MKTCETKLQEIRERVAGPRTEFERITRDDIEMLLKMVSVAREALNTIKAAMSMSSSFGTVRVMYECAESASAYLDRLAGDGG